MIFLPQSSASIKLSTILEKLTCQLGGIVKLAKINLEQNQQLAAQLQVQAIPTVFGFKMDNRLMASPITTEGQVKAFIKRLTGNAKLPLRKPWSMQKHYLKMANQNKQNHLQPASVMTILTVLQQGA